MLRSLPVHVQLVCALGIFVMVLLATSWRTFWALGSFLLDPEPITYNPGEPLRRVALQTNGQLPLARFVLFGGSTRVEVIDPHRPGTRAFLVEGGAVRELPSAPLAPSSRPFDPALLDIDRGRELAQDAVRRLDGARFEFATLSHETRRTGPTWKVSMTRSGSDLCLEYLAVGAFLGACP